jgi:hypothetical protein
MDSITDALFQKVALLDARLIEAAFGISRSTVERWHDLKVLPLSGTTGNVRWFRVRDLAKAARKMRWPDAATIVDFCAEIGEPLHN